MKSVKLMLCMLVSVLTIFPLSVFAASFTNLNGVRMSEEDYNNFLTIYTEENIMHMTQEKYDRIKDLDYSNVRSAVKYLETTYNPYLGITTERELTEEEYNNFSPEIVGQTRSGGNSFETTAKKLQIDAVDNIPVTFVTLSCTWKYIPNVRSFDVIGINADNFYSLDGFQHGEQNYILNGNYTTINYSWNGTNIKRFDQGFGISMNIVDTNITYLQTYIEGFFEPYSTTGELDGSYQHAVSTLTLADSKNYTMSGAGLGGVFVYPYNIASKYDGMSGVHIYY